MEVNSSTGYYPEPYSLYYLPGKTLAGLIIIGCLATLSLLTTFAAICFIAYRMLSWKKCYKQAVSSNQYVVLIFNLLIADFLQSSSLVMSFHWIQKGGILAPTGWCWAQGGLLHIGNLASGFFVLCIALHTLCSVSKGQRVLYGWFVGGIIAIWISALALTISGPLRYGKPFIARAGNWCWISEQYDADRLWLHYLWIFIDEFGTTAIYLCLFIYFSRHMRVFRSVSVLPQSCTRLMKVSRYMCLYPTVYVSLTLPLAVCRMITLSGSTPSDTGLLVAGALITSCGWFDATVYTLTRRILINNEAHVPTPYARSSSSEQLNNINHHDNSMQRFGNCTTISTVHQPAEPWKDATSDTDRSPDPEMAMQIATLPAMYDGLGRARSPLSADLGFVTKETTVSVFRSPAEALGVAALHATEVLARDSWRPHSVPDFSFMERVK